MRPAWPIILSVALASGLLYFVGAFMAALVVAFATYALASDQVTGIAVWAGPVLWSILAILVLKRAFATRASRAGPMALVLLAGPILGYGLTYAIAGFRAGTILEQRLAQAEARLLPGLPFALPSGCRATRGATYGPSQVSLTYTCPNAPSRVLAHFRSNLPRSWRQCRAWDTRHVFVSPRGDDGLESSISVDLTDADQTAFTVSTSSRSELTTEDFGKLQDLQGNPLP